MITKIINFKELVGDFDLSPSEAIDFFTKKGLRKTFDYRDMIAEEHTAAFTVAKMMDTDLLSTVQDRLKSALDSGTTFAQFQKELIPELQKAGWWGKKDVVDPLTGKVIKAQLGSASRLETIFRTNMQRAYAVARWDMIQRNAKTAPYLMYDAIDDLRTREKHRKWDGTVLPVTDPFWHEFTPPIGYNCRCSVTQLSASDLEDYGLSVAKSPIVERRKWTNPRTGKTHVIPTDIDPGWNNNPGIKADAGANRLTALNVIAEEKFALLPPPYQAAISVAKQTMTELIKSYMLEIAVALLILTSDAEEKIESRD